MAIYGYPEGHPEQKVRFDGSGSNPTAEQVRYTPGAGVSLASKNVKEAIDELFTSGSEGKALIASAITSKGVETQAGASFAALAEAIRAIGTGGGLPDDLYRITLAADPPEGGTVSGGGYASAGMTCNAIATPNASGGYKFKEWQENGTTVSGENPYNFVVTANRLLTANFVISSKP